MRKLRKSMLALFLAAALILAGGTCFPAYAETNEETVIPDPALLAGTWRGDAGSLFVLREDYTADYREDNLALTDCTWAIEDNAFVLTLQEIDLVLRAKLDPAALAAGEVPALVLTCDDENWEEETFRKDAPPSPIIDSSLLPGTWQSDQGGRFVFSDDGTAVYTEGDDSYDALWSIRGSRLAIDFPSLGLVIEAEPAEGDSLVLTFREVSETASAPGWSEDTFYKVPADPAADPPAKLADAFSFDDLDGAWYGDGGSMILFRRNGQALYDHPELKAAVSASWSLEDQTLFLHLIDPKVTVEAVYEPGTKSLVFQGDESQWEEEAFTRGTPLTSWMLEGSYNGEDTDSFLLLNRDGTAWYRQEDIGGFNCSWTVRCGALELTFPDYDTTVRAEVHDGDVSSLTLTGDPAVWADETFTRTPTIFFPQNPAREYKEDGPMLDGSTDQEVAFGGLSFRVPAAYAQTDEIPGIDGIAFLTEGIPEGDAPVDAVVIVSFSWLPGTEDMIPEMGPDFAEAVCREAGGENLSEYVHTTAAGLPAGTYLYTVKEEEGDLTCYAADFYNPENGYFYHLTLVETDTAAHYAIGGFADLLNSVRITEGDAIPDEDAFDRSLVRPEILEAADAYEKALDALISFTEKLDEIPEEEYAETVPPRYTSLLKDVWETEQAFRDLGEKLDTKEDYLWYMDRAAVLARKVRILSELLE